jgi:putative colanic acid biosynthesis acetyltransferase WcaF
MNQFWMRWFAPSWRPAVLRLFGADVGTRVFIRHWVRVLWLWKLQPGDDCWIGEDAWLFLPEKIKIGHDACVSQTAFLCTGSHRADDPRFRYDNAPIVFSPGPWVCAGALVLGGSSVPPGHVVPARSVFSRFSGAA